MKYEEEAVNQRTGYPIDILVKEGQNFFAIEVDRPALFWGASRQVKGGSMLKRMHLELLGYRATSVSYWDWASLSGQAKKEEYIRRVLENVR